MEARPPPRRLGDAGVEHREVDQSVGSHEEVRQESWHNIEITNQDTDEADSKHQYVTSDRVIIFAPSNTESLNVGI